jgi:hypothetical protein
MVFEQLTNEQDEEFEREHKKPIEKVDLSCYRKTDQGVVQIKELPPYDDILNEMQSSGTLSVPVLNYVTLMLAFGKSIHRKDNVDPNSANVGDINMNADKKLDVDPCNDRRITNFVDQGEKDQIQPSQTESIEKVDFISVTSTLRGQNAIKDVDFAKHSLDRSKTDQIGLKTGQTGCLRGFGHKAKSKMLKPKNPEVHVWKVNEAKGRYWHKVKKLKPEKFQAKSQKPNCSKYASWPKNSKHEKSPHDRNWQWNNYDTSMLIPSHRPYNCTPWGLIMMSFFIHHGLQRCHLLQYTFIQFRSLMEDYQLVGHHLHIMTDLIQTIGLWVKLNVR